MSWQVPVRFDRPVEVKIGEGAQAPYRRFRVYDLNTSTTRIGPVPQGKAWYPLSLSLEMGEAGHSAMVTFIRTLAGVQHWLYRAEVTGSVQYVWSIGVDSRSTARVGTLPLPDLVLNENDYIEIGATAGVVQWGEMHVMEGDVQ